MNWFKAFMLVELGTWFWLYRSGKAEAAALLLKKAAGQPLSAEEQRQLETLQGQT